MPDVGLKRARIGAERLPVLVGDGFDQMSSGLRAAAARSTFSRKAAYYPGIRAAAPPGYADLIVRACGEIITRTFGGTSLVVEECAFSLVTDPPETLSLFQRLPHFDGVEANRLAILHYLCDGSFGGTSFYRHRSTGFESVDADRHSTYDARLRDDLTREGEPPAVYRTGSDILFEETASFDCRPGRFLIYRGTTLHSGRIPDGALLSPDPLAGRLTLNTFLRCEGG